jgi:tRNA/tmRNA/rRNA uracil-C5-methylase (TrmA/RlmC/RlmD family)
VCGGRGGEEAGGEEACEFDAVLVDPPRAGLDLDTLRY